MSYQGAINSVVTATAGAMSVARLIYQNSPEYKAKVEQKKEAAAELAQKKQEDKTYTNLQNKAFQATEDYINQGDDTLVSAVEKEGKANYERTGDVRYRDLAGGIRGGSQRLRNEQNPLANLFDQLTNAQNALEAEKQQKRQKQSWRNEPIKGGGNIGELYDKVSPEAKKVIEEAMKNDGK